MANRGPRGTDNFGLLLATLEPGTWVGAYEIVARGASRGIGHVYVARDAERDRRVAITILPSAQTRPRGMLLDREPIEELDHPGIPRVLDTGVLPDRRPWVASELVDGRTLDTVEAATAGEIAALVRDVADILDHAHVRGVVHRHLTPHLIVVRKGIGSPCVIDWGGATAAMPLAALPYVAPEQRRGAATDERVDVYALGAIARELLRNRAPKSDTMVVGAASRGADDAVPPVLVALVRRMVAGDPAQRPTAHEVRDHTAWLADQLGHAIPSEIEHETTEPLPPMRRPITSEMVQTISGEITPAPRRSRSN